MNPKQVEEHLSCAVELAESAGAIALRYFRRPLEVEDKSSGAWFDPVTRADREIEAFLREELSRRFPGYGIVGEEHPDTCGTAGKPCWVIDPIDGTRAFMSGMPAWGTLVGLTEDGVCLAGVMHQPYLRETFFGSSRGSRLQCEGGLRRLTTSATEEVGSAILYCTHPSMFVEESHRRGFEQVAASSRLSRYGGDCYAYCMLAMGQVDLVIEDNLQPYDIVPLIPIIEAAGGTVTRADGKPAGEGGFVVAAATAALHAEALEILHARD